MAHLRVQTGALPEEGASDEPERVADAELVREELCLVAADVSAGRPGKYTRNFIIIIRRLYF